jgi:site-specific DNA recombinase
LNRVRELAHGSRFDVLVVREIDRLSRNLAKQLIVEEELKHSGVFIEYVLGDYPDTPEGNLMKHVRASVAEFERLKISERMVRGRYLKVRAGSVLVAKHPPYGYDVATSDNGKKYALVFNPAEAQVVDLIYRLFLDGSGKTGPLAMSEIARRLTELKAPIPRSAILKRRTEEWSQTTVHMILENRTYAGVWTYGKTNRGKHNAPDNHVQVKVPAIVTEKMWVEVQARLSRNKARMLRRVVHDYLLRRRLQCGICGRLMQGETQAYFTRKRKKDYKYYVCERTQTLPRPCPGFRCSADRADPVVWEWIKSLMLNPKRLEQGLKSYQAVRDNESEPLRSQIQLIDAQLTNYRSQLERLIDLYLSNEIAKDMLVDRKARLESTVAALEKEKSELDQQLETKTLTAEQIKTILDFATAIRDRLSYADENFAARRQLIELLDVTGRVVKEEEGLFVYTRCIIASDTLQLEETATCAH